MHILVVDDNEEILDLLKNLLESGDFDVTVTKSGKESLNLIKRKNFDIVLLDITMPEFSGLDVVKSLNESGDLAKNKIILFTAASISDTEIEKWIKIGVKQCLKKPFEPGALFEAISNVSTAT